MKTEGSEESAIDIARRLASASVSEAEKEVTQLIMKNIYPSAEKEKDEALIKEIIEGYRKIIGNEKLNSDVDELESIKEALREDMGKIGDYIKTREEMRKKPSIDYQALLTGIHSELEKIKESQGELLEKVEATIHHAVNFFSSGEARGSSVETHLSGAQFSAEEKEILKYLISDNKKSKDDVVSELNVLTIPDLIEKIPDLKKKEEQIAALEKKYARLDDQQHVHEFKHRLEVLEKMKDRFLSIEETQMHTILMNLKEMDELVMHAVEPAPVHTAATEVQATPVASESFVQATAEVSTVAVQTDNKELENKEKELNEKSEKLKNREDQLQTREATLDEREKGIVQKEKEVKLQQAINTIHAKVNDYLGRRQTLWRKIKAFFGIGKEASKQEQMKAVLKANTQQTMVSAVNKLSGFKETGGIKKDLKEAVEQIQPAEAPRIRR